MVGVNTLKLLNKESVLAMAQESNVLFVRLQFVDILGTPKNIIIPASGLQSALDDGIPFDASSTRGAEKTAPPIDGNNPIIAGMDAINILLSMTSPLNESIISCINPFFLITFSNTLISVRIIISMIVVLLVIA